MDIVLLDDNDVMDHLVDLVDLLQDSVDNGASVSFLAPMDRDLACDYWIDISTDVENGKRIVFAALEEDNIVGSVQLVLATVPNGQHRAEVQKLLVHTAYRQRGIAKALMTALEAKARELNRFLLVLDTERGSVAEPMYERFGYTRLGAIPNYCLSSKGELHDTVVFYKQI